MNAVKFGKLAQSEQSIILSGSSDKTVRVWGTSGNSTCDHQVTNVLEGHVGSVNCLAFNPSGNVIVSGSADGALKVWWLDVTEEKLHASLVQTVDVAAQLLPLCLALSNLGADGDLVLAVAGTKGIVQVYISGSEESEFRLQATLVGHENWVRSLAITAENGKENSDLLIASASQDKYIRLWRISQDKISVTNGSSTKRNFMSSLSNKAHRLQASQTSCLLTFEALLLGHEDWIYTVQWHATGDKLQLLSASADNSLAIWEAEESSGIWLCNTRLGEISAQKGSTTATGSAGGFWIGLWSPNGENVVSLGRTGSWRLWNHDRGLERWSQVLGVSGHVGSITGIAWAKDGAFLLSTGSDQTTRLHAAWKHKGRSTWHEFARPQIHGYDLNCIDTLGTTRFISGADEKSLRVFDEPKAIAELLQRLCGISTPSDHALPDTANIPALGLSNKAVEEIDVGRLSNNEANHEDTSHPPSIAAAKMLDLQHPPLEDHLARHTLWPEREKLYGHGYEISAVATSHDGKVIATACRASSIDHAVIRLYETNDWREIKPALTCHSLTVTCLRFSADDRYLLSVSRDRQWAVYVRDPNNPEKYTLAVSESKGHSRMILSASWAPVAFGRMFVTTSRDKTIRVWELLDKEAGLGSTLLMTMNLPSAVTAVDTATTSEVGALAIALGTEYGEVTVSIMTLPYIIMRSVDKIAYA